VATGDSHGALVHLQRRWIYIISGLRNTTNHSSGPSRAIGLMCLYIWQITSQVNDLSVSLTLTLSRSSLKLEVTAQSLRSQEENQLSNCWNGWPWLKS